MSRRTAWSRPVTSRSYQRWMVVMGAGMKLSKSAGAGADGSEAVRGVGLAEVGGEDDGVGGS